MEMKKRLAVVTTVLLIILAIASPASANSIVSAAAGGTHGLAVSEDGTVWAWGENYSGQLGDGTTTGRTAAAVVPGLSDVVAVAAGYDHSLALQADGTLWAWGANYEGQLGDGTTIGRRSPFLVMTGVKDIAAGAMFTMVLKQDDSVWLWGDNYWGSIGDGTSTNRSTPYKVTTNVKKIAAGGYHAIIEKNDNTFWGWGANHYGQLGDGTTTQRKSPVQLTNLSDIVKVSLGCFHSLAIKSDGTVLAWGDNNSSALGDGTTVNKSLPVPVKNSAGNGTLTGIVDISAGQGFSLFLKSDGTINGAGYNLNGQLGIGTTTWRESLPVQVKGIDGNGVLSDIQKLSQSSFAMSGMAIRSAGSPVAWGRNDYGQLGDGTKTDRSTPVRVKDIFSPEVTGTNPAQNAVEVPVNQNLTINFDTNVYPGTELGKIALKKGSAKALFNLEFKDQTMVVKPVGGLAPDAVYTLFIPQYGVKDSRGVGMISSYTLTFKTPDSIAPVVKKANPAVNKVNVPLNQAITLSFSEEIKAGPGFDQLRITDGSQNIAIETYSVQGSTLILNPLSMTYNQGYTVIVPANAITDSAGNPMASEYNLSFTTVPDKVKPTVTSANVNANAREIPLDQTFTITYSESVSAGPNYAAVALKMGATVVDSTVTISGNTLTVKPNASLETFRQYTLSLPAGAVVDSAGNVAAGYTLKFTTFDPKPTVVSTDPVDKAINVPINKSIDITFDEEISEGGNINKILLKQGTTVVEYTYSINGDKLTITPTAELAKDAVITLTVPAGAVQDTEGNAGEGCKLTIKSLETVPPVVASTYPVNAKTNIPLDKDIVIKFKEDIQAGANFANITLSSGGLDVPISREADGKVLTLKPEAKLNYNTDYTVTLPEGAVADLAGNGMADGLTFSFTTKVDKDKPEVIKSNIKNNAINVPAETVFTLNFNETITEGLNITKVLLKSGSTTVPFNHSISGNTMTISPTQAMNYSAKTTLSIPGGAVKDEVENLNKPFKITFTTRQNSEVPVVTAASGQDEVTGSIALTFNMNILKGINFKFIAMKDASSGAPVPAITTVVDKTVTVKPKVHVAGIQYELYLPTGAFKDTGGNPSLAYDSTAAPANNAPVAVNDTATVNMGGSVLINVTANDTDQDGDPLTVTGMTQGANGTVVKEGNSLRYTPNTDYSGTDSFNYTISDGKGGTATGTVNVTVNESVTEVLPLMDIETATGSTDFIRVDIAQAGNYEFITGYYKESCDTVIYLFDGAQNLIASNDDYFNLYGYIAAYLDPGTYYVKIEEFSFGPLYCNFEVKKI